MSGAGAVEVHRLHLSDVTPAPHLPWARPTFPVFGLLVVHPDGPILIDSGVGIGNRFIDQLYSPVHHSIDEALDRHGLRVDDVTTVITSHLHFDHCGQNSRLGGATILVQRAEVDAATAALYTVPEWAFPPGVELTMIDGDLEVANGVQIIASPGHTPGHQSVVIDDGHGNPHTIGGDEPPVPPPGHGDQRARPVGPSPSPARTMQGDPRTLHGDPR